MKAVIADDEAHLARHLQARLAALWPELEIAAIAANGEEALAAIEQHAPAIAFLDIRMPGLSGLEVAARLSPARRQSCRLVFVTAYEQYAVEAFERAAVDYLLKPVSDERLQQTVARLRQSPPALAPETLTALRELLAPAATAEPLRWIRAQSGDSLRLIAVDEVCYFQASDKYTAVFTRDGETLIRTPIRDLAGQLDGQQFWQIHRATLVNVRQIAAIRHDALGRLRLQLKDRPESLAVSRSYAHLFRQM